MLWLGGGTRTSLGGAGEAKPTPKELPARSMVAEQAESTRDLADGDDAPDDGCSHTSPRIVHTQVAGRRSHMRSGEYIGTPWRDAQAGDVGVLE